MSLPVVVKSSKRGLQLILDADLDFTLLLDEVKKKFQNTKEFFKNAEFAISFSGRTLTTEEEIQLLQTIESSGEIKIICILKEQELLDTYLEQVMQQKSEEHLQKCGLFHKGNVETGEKLECDSSVIILGDICTGGKVTAKGNIIVLGSVYGSVHAGADGRLHAFICAGEVLGDSLKIGDISLSKKQMHRLRTNQTKDNLCFIAKDNSIIMDSLKSGGYLHE